MNTTLQLADEYIRFTNHHIFLTGKAGTGKTTFLKKIQETCPKRLAVVAPTGIAAINAAGVTMHSFFGLPFGPFIPGSESFSRSGYHRLSREKSKVIKSLDLLIIDEISMVRADILDAVDHVLRRHRKNNAPFGGVQLLMVGDLQQLAPVVTANEQPILEKYYDTPYFFSSNVLKNIALIGIELEKIYRQTDKEFINLLNYIRNNQNTEAVLAKLNHQYAPDLRSQDYPDYITLCTHNRQADNINTARLAELATATHSFQAIIEGEFPEKSFPAAEALELKVGCQVMFIRNDLSPEKKYFNGKIGSVTKIDETEIQVLCKGEKIPLTVEPSKWENIKYSLDEERGEIVEKIIGSFSQFPLRLAWAFTIHKSQGLTFDKIIIDAKAAFSHGQVYVALSRCRTLNGIVLSSLLNNRSIKVDPHIVQFSEDIRRSKESHKESLENEKSLYQQQLLLDCFDFQKLDQCLNRFISLIKRYKNQVQISGCNQIDTLHEDIRREICVIGQNFQRQLQGLYGQELLPADNPVIIERITKASDYFDKKINELFTSPFEHLLVETDNKEIQKQINKAHDTLNEVVAIKVAAVTSCNTSFSPENYQRAISAAAVKFASNKVQRKKKSDIMYTEDDVDHPELFQRMKEWRSQTAKELGVPAFHVIHQKTLVQIAVHLPETIKALQHIKGVGQVTSDRYGEAIASMVRDYRQKHSITSVYLPIFSLEKIAKAKSQSKKNTKEISLELFNQGMNIQDIAQEREMNVQTIENHMAHWVSERKVTIDKFVPKEKKQKIEQAFKEMGITPLKKAKEFLGDEFSYGELTLVRSHLQLCKDC